MGRFRVGEWLGDGTKKVRDGMVPGAGIARGRYGDRMVPGRGMARRRYGEGSGMGWYRVREWLGDGTEMGRFRVGEWLGDGSKKARDGMVPGAGMARDGEEMGRFRVGEWLGDGTGMARGGWYRDGRGQNRNDTDGPPPPVTWGTYQVPPAAPDRAPLRRLPFVSGKFLRGVLRHGLAGALFNLIRRSPVYSVKLKPVHGPAEKTDAALATDSPGYVTRGHVHREWMTQVGCLCGTPRLMMVERRGVCLKADITTIQNMIILTSD